MVVPTLIRRLCAKRMTIPRLSPTQTKARLDAFCVQDGDVVASYDLVLDVTPSSDMTIYNDADDNDSSSTSAAPPIIMTIETHDDGTVRQLRPDLVGQWIPVGTTIGVIDDGDAVDGDWTWQAYYKKGTGEE
jgi:pyruvate/2-oxoglutarate dehydrogenase complex dihydrolipoamide acyltransferase (E2) component